MQKNAAQSALMRINWRFMIKLIYFIFHEALL